MYFRLLGLSVEVAREPAVTGQELANRLTGCLRQRQELLRSRPGFEEKAAMRYYEDVDADGNVWPSPAPESPEHTEEEEMQFSRGVHHGYDHAIWFCRDLLSGENPNKYLPRDEA